MKMQWWLRAARTLAQHQMEPLLYENVLLVAVTTIALKAPNFHILDFEFHADFHDFVDGVASHRHLGKCGDLSEVERTSAAARIADHRNLTGVRVIA
jgi:hypothetical protein